MLIYAVDLHFVKNELPFLSKSMVAQKLPSTIGTCPFKSYVDGSKLLLSFLVQDANTAVAYF